jgi:hypothetical protein
LLVIVMCLVKVIVVVKACDSNSRVQCLQFREKNKNTE